MLIELQPDGLRALLAIVEQLKLEPALLHEPELSLLKELLQSWGCKVPSKPGEEPLTPPTPSRCWKNRRASTSPSQPTTQRPATPPQGSESSEAAEVRLESVRPLSAAESAILAVQECVAEKPTVLASSTESSVSAARMRPETSSKSSSAGSVASAARSCPEHWLNGSQGSHQLPPAETLPVPCGPPAMRAPPSICMNEPAVVARSRESQTPQDSDSEHAARRQSASPPCGSEHSAGSAAQPAAGSAGSERASERSALRQPAGSPAGSERGSERYASRQPAGSLAGSERGSERLSWCLGSERGSEQSAPRQTAAAPSGAVPTRFLDQGVVRREPVECLRGSIPDNVLAALQWVDQKLEAVKILAISREEAVQRGLIPGAALQRFEEIARKMKDLREARLTPQQGMDLDMLHEDELEEYHKMLAQFETLDTLGLTYEEGVQMGYFQDVEHFDEDLPQTAQADRDKPPGAGVRARPHGKDTIPQLKAAPSSPCICGVPFGTLNKQVEAA